MKSPTILISTWSSGLFALNADRRTEQEITTHSVRGLAPDGYGGALAIVGDHLLQQRSPAPARWTTIATSPLQLSCCVAAQNVIYAGTDDARVLRLVASECGQLHTLEGFDHLAGRNTWYAGSAIVNGERMGPPLGIRSLAVNADSSIVFANVHVGGIPRSLDGGVTWEPTIDIHADVHEVRAHPSDPRLVAAAFAVGLCISRDAGATWTFEQRGLHAPHCSAIAFSGDHILVSAATDPFTRKGRVYRRTLNSTGPLYAIAGGNLPLWLEGSADTGCIATQGSFLAIADRAGNLYTSGDYGQSWHLRTTGLPLPSGILFC